MNTVIMSLTMLLAGQGGVGHFKVKVVPIVVGSFSIKAVQDYLFFGIDFFNSPGVVKV